MEEKIFQVVREAARAGGDVLSSYFELTELEREIKDDKSFVTKADREAEDAIIKVIKASFPEHAIVAEESGEQKTNSSYSWIIDPLDGTSNFLNGIPIFSVSIGVYKNGEPLAAAVYHPPTRGMFAAAQRRGTFFNGKKVSVSKQEAMAGLVTFGTGRQTSDGAQFDALFSGLRSVFKSRRNLGSTALEMAYIARGGVEATVSIGTETWNHAAGALLVLEAGGKIMDFTGKPWKLGEKYFIATNGVVHDALLKAVRATM